MRVGFPKYTVDVRPGQCKVCLPYTKTSAMRKGVRAIAAYYAVAGHGACRKNTRELIRQNPAVAFFGAVRLPCLQDAKWSLISSTGWLEGSEAGSGKQGLVSARR